MSFFDLPPAAIDYAALDAFLQERLPESLNLDYKRQLSESVFETIAAMANTYGGIILLGVDEDPAEPTRPLLPPLGVDRSDRERLVNQSYTRFQPPFAPDVVPVLLEAGNVVLVIRVDPRRADRPVVVTRGDTNKIPIRLEARNAPADRYRMAELFSEPSASATAIAGPGNWTLANGLQYPLDDMNHPALTVRVAVEAQIPLERLDVAVIDTTDRRNLAAALEHSPLNAWLSMQVGEWAGSSWSSTTWEPVEKAYSNKSFIATLGHRSWFDTGVQAPFVGQASLLLPAGTHVFTGRLTLLLDAAYDPDPMFDSSEKPMPRPRLNLESIYRLFRALLDTALDVAAPATFPRILGVPVWERIGPTVYVQVFQSPADASTGIGNFVNLDAYVGRTPANLELLGATFMVPRTSDIETSASRDEVVRQWLTRLFLDMSLERFEDDLAAM